MRPWLTTPMDELVLRVLLSQPQKIKMRQIEVIEGKSGRP